VAGFDVAEWGINIAVYSETVGSFSLEADKMGASIAVDHGGEGSVGRCMPIYYIQTKKGISCTILVWGTLIATEKAACGIERPKVWLAISPLLGETLVDTGRRSPRMDIGTRRGHEMRVDGERHQTEKGIE